MAIVLEEKIKVFHLNWLDIFYIPLPYTDHETSIQKIADCTYRGSVNFPLFFAVRDHPKTLSDTASVRAATVTQERVRFNPVLVCRFGPDPTQPSPMIIFRKEWYVVCGLKNGQLETFNKFCNTFDQL